MRNFRSAWVAAVCGSVMMVLGGCGNATVAVQSGAVSSSPLSEDAPAGFQDYYAQSVEFVPCLAEQIVIDPLPAPKDLDNYECATLQAPLDWSDSSSDPIELAVARYSTKKTESASALFYNLGGPGSASVDSLSTFVTTMATKSLVDGYQIVALDPRGVGASTPITCWDAAERDTLFSASDMPPEGSTLDEEISYYREEFAATGAQCLEYSGQIVAHADTNSAARDFDLVRAVLGQEKLDYLGYSYGTLLGATYAELFPDKAGRLVLDAALDPALNINQVTAAQAQGMEESLYNWIETCQAEKNCPIAGDLESGKQQMIDFFDSVTEQPLSTSNPDRPLTVSLARTGVIGSLYSPDSYQYLTMGMQKALAGDGSILLLLADFYNGRNTDGSYSNTQDAFTAINALDYEPVGTVEQWQAESDRLAAEYPVLGEQFAFGSASLEAWPFPVLAPRHEITAPGSPNILVIGGTHDPATPYSMSVSLAASLENGILVTRDGWGHASYIRDGSACINDIVDGFFLQGDVPQSGVVCTE